jgi:hypothetical protein
MQQQLARMCQNRIDDPCRMSGAIKDFEFNLLHRKWTY